MLLKTMPTSPPDTGGTLLSIRSGITVTRADPASDAAVMLMEQLSAALSQITGDTKDLGDLRLTVRQYHKIFTVLNRAQGQ